MHRLAVDQPPLKCPRTNFYFSNHNSLIKQMIYHLINIYHDTAKLCTNLNVKLIFKAMNCT